MKTPEIETSGTRDWSAYAIAAVSYVALGLLWKPSLNWVLGPSWIVAVVWVLRARRT